MKRFYWAGPDFSDALYLFQGMDGGFKYSFRWSEMLEQGSGVNWSNPRNARKADQVKKVRVQIIFYQT